MESTGIVMDKQLAHMIKHGLTYLMSPTQSEYKRGSEAAGVVGGI